MMVLLFKSQPRVDADERNCRATCARMMELVEKIPGFPARSSTVYHSWRLGARRHERWPGNRLRSGDALVEVMKPGDLRDCTTRPRGW
jgi:hypothetical protein